MADFDYDVSQWVAKSKSKGDQVFRAIAEAAVARVKELTPVRTGFLRANWTAIMKGDSEPKPGESGGANRIATARAGDVISIVNPVAYARAVEYGRTVPSKDGMRTIPGRGMVQQTIAEMPSIAERVVRRFR